MPSLSSSAKRTNGSSASRTSKLILFGEKSLQRAVSNYLEHYQ
jgi:hypothetical protein